MTLCKSKIFTLFDCCKMVEGEKRAIICDLQRSSYFNINNDIATVIKSSLGLSKVEILKKYGDDKKKIEELIDVLIVNEIGFFTTSSELFIKSKIVWHHYSLITNAILALSNILEDRMKEVVIELEILGCQHIQLIGYESFDLTILFSILNTLKGKDIKSVELILKWDKNICQQFIYTITKMFPRICKLLLHSHDENGEIRIKRSASPDIIIVKSKEQSFSRKLCGNISIDHFCTSIPQFHESHYYNSCLNRKISIDAEGNIKNCPSMTESFGNIKDTTLAEALEKPGFKKYWNINKDKIHVCKDCEFRYICTDCRAYVEDPKDILSKPLKCGYNPYTGEWSEWSTNPLKQKAIEFYGMREMVDEMNAD